MQLVCAPDSGLVLRLKGWLINKEISVLFGLPNGSIRQFASFFRDRGKGGINIDVYAPVDRGARNEGHAGVFFGVVENPSIQVPTHRGSQDRPPMTLENTQPMAPCTFLATHVGHPPMHTPIFCRDAVPLALLLFGLVNLTAACFYRGLSLSLFLSLPLSLPPPLAFLILFRLVNLTAACVYRTLSLSLPSPLALIITFGPV